MTTPTHSERAARPFAPLTRDRWRVVDAILQRALACEPAERTAVVGEACGTDAALRAEVESLLAAHANAGDDFLEPAARPLDASIAPLRDERDDNVDALRAMLREMLAREPLMPASLPGAAASEASESEVRSAPRVASPGRAVSARAALYAAVITLVVGLTGGLLIDRSSLARRWNDVASALARPAQAAGDALPATSPVASPATESDGKLVVVDRAGRPLRVIPATRPWTPRFSPDGRMVAYGAFGAGRQTSDLWVTDLEAGTTRRLTDDDGDANDPQWSADGATLVYSVSAPGGKDVVQRPLGGGPVRVVAARDGTQFPSDWLRDGSATLVTEETASDRHDILVQPTDGSAARPYAATAADERAARISPDRQWVAYTSDVSGRQEVYLDSYPRPGQRVQISSGGGIDPVWRGDGRELYYWRDGALVAVQLGVAARGESPTRGAETVLFRAQYYTNVNTMYDVSSDGRRFVIVEQR